MATASPRFFDLIEKSLRLEIHEARSTLVGYPHATGWRVLPYLVVAQVDYAGTMEFRDRAMITVRPGQAIALAPGLPHNFTKTSRRAAYSHWAHLQCEVFPGISLFSLIETPLINGGARAKKIGHLNHELGKLSSADPSLTSVLQRQSLGLELISTLLGPIVFREDRLALIRHASRLTPVLAHMEENLAQPLSHDSLARTASLSPSRFHFLFRSALGLAPYEFLQRLRLKKAQEMLLRTDLSIAEIGRAVGHPDQYHFSRTFRRHFGISPLKYRQQMILPSF